MPMFTVTEKGVDKPRLFEAKSREKAVDAAIAGRFTVDIVTKASDVVKLIANGVAAEDAAEVIANGGPIAPPSPPAGDDDTKGQAKA